MSLYVAGYIFRLKDRTGIGERMANLRSAFTAFETMHLGLRSHFLHLTADIQGTIETYASSIYEQGWFITTARDFDGRRAYQFSVHGNGVKHMSLELAGGSTAQHYHDSIQHKRGVVIRSPDMNCCLTVLLLFIAASLSFVLVSFVNPLFQVLTVPSLI